MTPRLYLLMGHAPTAIGGVYLSLLGRELLSTLAASQGFDCPANGWSPRGSGPPLHPSLPSPWRGHLTHRQGRVIAGLANVPAGIDLEYRKPRHATRLRHLIELLPEEKERHAILGSKAPLDTFYRAWTLHEALFKLENLTTPHLTSPLHTRLSTLAPEGEIHAWQWQEDGWTFSLCSPIERLAISSPLEISLEKSWAPA